MYVAGIPFKLPKKSYDKGFKERKWPSGDNYTCRMCGKYTDGVGLQIDHIMPVSKGGKSVPSNLQVLCSKCNGRKSGRLFQQPKQRTDK